MKLSTAPILLSMFLKLIESAEILPMAQTHYSTNSSLLLNKLSTNNFMPPLSIIL
jgi:hypothetical protein